MPLCPVCEHEYLPHITRCPDCDAELVRELPDGRPPVARNVLLAMRLQAESEEVPTLHPLPVPGADVQSPAGALSPQVRTRRVVFWALLTLLLLAGATDLWLISHPFADRGEGQFDLDSAVDGQAPPAPSHAATPAASYEPPASTATYSQVIATYPKGIKLCSTEARLTSTDDGLCVMPGSAVDIRDGKMLIQWYGAKLTADAELTLGGKTYKRGTKLTVDKNLNWVEVSSWESVRGSTGTPTYSQVVATYPKHIKLCSTEVLLASREDGLCLMAGATLDIRKDKILIRWYGTKLTTFGEVNLDGKTYQDGAKLTVDKHLNWVEVSSWGPAGDSTGTRPALGQAPQLQEDLQLSASMGPSTKQSKVLIARPGRPL